MRVAHVAGDAFQVRVRADKGLENLVLLVEVLLEIADRFSFHRIRYFNVITDLLAVQGRREPVKNGNVRKENDGKYVGYEHQIIIGKVQDTRNKRCEKDACEEQGEAQYDVFVE